jgi:hypothetical protein
LDIDWLWPGIVDASSSPAHDAKPYFYAFSHQAVGTFVDGLYRQLIVILGFRRPFTFKGRNTP